MTEFIVIITGLVVFIGGGAFGAWMGYMTARSEASNVGAGWYEIVNKKTGEIRWRWHEKPPNCD